MARRDSVDGSNGEAVTPRDLSANFRALADVTRLRILHDLWNTGSLSGVTVTDLCETLRVSQPLMSWHLRILRRAGLVTTHRSGRLVYCSIDRSVAGSYGSVLLEYLTGASEEQPAHVAEGLRLSESLQSIQTAS